MDYAEIYAVDFDGTLNLADTYPELGEPNAELIEFLKERRAAGDKIILWTCREGELLKAAVKYCNNYGLFFHAVNENLQENIEYFGNNCRKVWAHHYIDDKNMIPGIEASQYLEKGEVTLWTKGKIRKILIPEKLIRDSAEYFSGLPDNKWMFPNRYGWIPVEERLPEADEDTEETIEDDDCPEYIVTIRGASESTTLKYSPDGTWFDENGYVYDVIAWRPLPEVYRPADKTERSEVK